MKKVLLMVVCLQSLWGITPYHRHHLSFMTQNDAYITPRIDQYYTAGHSLTYTSNEGDYGWLNHFGWITGATSFHLSLSQNIYAPKAKFDLLPPSNDHPYAGFLSLVFGIHHRDERRLESLGLRIGVSGKIAFGEQVQNRVHQALGVGEAKGWQTQLGNEIIVNTYYELVYKHSLYQSAYFEIDVLPSVEVAFGVANIYAKLNALFRLGYQLQSTFLPQGMIGENSGMQTGRVYHDGFGAFVFFGIGGGYVMRKMAIEGNLFGQDSYARNLSLNPWVGNLSGGISLVSGALSATYQVIYISKEFQTQDSPHLIGSISLSYSF